VWWRPWHVKQLWINLEVTQLMPWCEPDQTQLLSLYICRPLVDRPLEKSCTCADRMVFLLTKFTSYGLGCYPCLVRIYSSRRCTGGECFWVRLTRAWRWYVFYGFYGPVTLCKECVHLLPRRNLGLVVQKLFPQG